MILWLLTTIRDGREIDSPILFSHTPSQKSAYMSHKKALKSAFDRFKPEMVVVYSVLNGSMAIDLAHKREIPTIFHSLDVLHQIADVNPFMGPFIKLAEKRVYLKSDKIVAISKGLLEYAKEFGVRRSEIELLPPGVDFKRFASLSGGNDVREELGMTKDDIILFFMGHYYDFCGLDDVIENMGTLIGKLPSVKLISIGDGELRDRLHELVEIHGLEKSVFLLPRQDYDQVRKFLDAADICLLPFKQTEAATRVIPSKILEYMAAGKPVVCGNLPSVKAEFGENGIIYETDPGKFHNNISDLIKSGKMKTLGDQAKIFSKRYDYKRITPRFFKIIEEVSENFSKKVI
jgi:glycosyltransferase involved in cell wall biosynthesis